MRQQDGATTVEYWSGSRRVLYTPCSETEVYIALTMLDSDEAAKAIPVDRAAWKRWFPHLEPLIGRIGADGRYDRFEYIRLKRWSAGKVAVIGDAAHAHSAEHRAGRRLRHDERAVAGLLSRPRARRRRRRSPPGRTTSEPITDHTQRISLMLGWPTTWPPYLRAKTLALAGRSKWLVKQRTRTALHVPTGT